MRHRIKKIKFRSGIDSNRALMRKLAYNFLTQNKLTTSVAKAKRLISFLEPVLTKAKEKTEANKNYLLRRLTNRRLVNYLFEEVGPVIKARNGGYLRCIKQHQRLTDGTLLAKVEWTVPIIKPSEKKEKNGQQQAQLKIKKSELDNR